MQNVLAIVITLVSLATGTGLVWLLRRMGKADTAKELQDIIDSDALRDLLAEALPWLCTQAEKLLGGGTGAIKKSYVIQEAMKLLPENLRARLDITGIEQAIDTALVKLRPLWEDRLEIAVAAEALDAGPYLFKAGEDIAKGQTVELQALLLPVEDGEAEPAELTPEDAAAKFEQIKDDLCPVGHHWEPDGTGGFVAVLDAPAEDAAEESPKPKCKKRLAADVEPVPPAATEAASE